MRCIKIRLDHLYGSVVMVNNPYSVMLTFGRRTKYRAIERQILKPRDVPASHQH